MTSAGRKALVAVTLLAVSAAMVYGTWLAVDDMRAKPMMAQAAIGHRGDLVTLEIVNTSDFAWHDTTFTVNGRYRIVWPEPVEPGGTLGLTLVRFLDASGTALPWPEEPARELSATTTRRPRFARVNRTRVATGRWPFE